MTYVLIFLHFINTDNLKYYQIGTYSDLKEYQLEAEKAKIMVTHNSMKVACLEVSSQ